MDRVPGDALTDPALAPVSTSRGVLILWSWLPAAAMMAAIFLVSSIEDLAAPPGGISDHTGHFLAYGLLGALVLRAVSGARWSGVTRVAAIQAWLIAAAYGASDEFHQRFVRGRTAAFDDWVADAAGAGVAVLLILAAAAGNRLQSRGI